jgi:hypothetical protein
MQYGFSTLLIIHSILAVFLLGAITHQAVGAAWPVAKRAPGFVSAVRSVNGINYTNAVIILFLVTFAIGTIIYPAYRVGVRTVLQEYRDFKPEGMFEMKEHLLALSLDPWRCCRSTGSCGVRRLRPIGRRWHVEPCGSYDWRNRQGLCESA